MGTGQRIDLNQARTVALRSQLLFGTETQIPGKDGVASAVEHLGYVQIDTISVVERAHHHTLWNRCSGYLPIMLHELQSVDRRVFEYWGHAASYLPMSDYRYYVPMMKSHRDPKSKWARSRLEKCGHLMEGVLRRISKEGPLGSKDFKSDSRAGRSQWWDWKPAKTALELLFWRGDLMITRRENFHRIYDLTERVIPESTDTSEPSRDELGRFFVKKALQAHGIASESTIADHIHAAERVDIRNSLRNMIGDGEIIQLKIENESGYYAFPGLLDPYGKASHDRKVSILSPFDNLIINRKRTERIFDFSYALECYTPKKKRKFGYFVLPVLWGDRFMARIDAKADRKKCRLLVKKFLMEEGADPSLEFLQMLAVELRRFADFNGCEHISLDMTSPSSLRDPLRVLIDDSK